jgi:hypothetical protein
MNMLNDARLTGLVGGTKGERMREVVRWKRTRMLLAAALVGVLSTGCAARRVTENLLGQARQTLVDRYEQELGNIAMFLVVPDGLPQYIRINRGTVEARPEPRWSIGTDLYIAGGTRRALVWEIASVTDPGDLERLRLMFRWVTRHIEFDELERSWNEIRDQPEYTADAKQRFDSQGRPILRAAPLPISAPTGRDWYTTDEKEGVKGIDPGEYGNVRVWIKDLSGAVVFSLAVRRAMPNTRPPAALPMPGR